MDGYIGRGVGASSTSIIPFIHRRGGEKCTLRDGYDRVATRAKTKQISISRNRANLDCLSQINPRVNHDGTGVTLSLFSIGGNKSMIDVSFLFFFLFRRIVSKNGPELIAVSNY